MEQQQRQQEGQKQQQHHWRKEEQRGGGEEEEGLGWGGGWVEGWHMEGELCILGRRAHPSLLLLQVVVVGGM